MKTKYKLLLLFGILALFNACKKNSSNKPKSTSINKIMLLGASRVEGNRPNFESHRYELWKDLIENDWTFDFIGTQTDNASYPEVNGNKFDKDHEGRGGWTSEEILDGLDNWLNKTGSPDIVLFSSPGGNDALQNLDYNNTVTNINAIIDLLQSDNSNVTIIIEQMAPARSDAATTDLTNYFNQLQAEMLNIATNQSTTSSNVMAVDMYTGFTDAMCADEVHYNEAGADFIASKYYNVLTNILID